MRNQNGVYLSRRDFLLLAGLGCTGMAAAATCGGVMTALVLLSDEDDTAEPSISPQPATEVMLPPSPTPSVRYPNMVSRSEWGALAPNHAALNETGFYNLENPEGWRWYQEPLAAIYRTVVFHHSVSYESDDLSTLLDIQDTHRQARGWADIGYHYFIGKSGTVFEGRDIHVRGTHVEGYNTGSIGVCLMGNFMQEIPNDAQIGAVISLTQWLKNRFQLTHLAAHRDFVMTFCPGDYLINMLDNMAAGTGLIRGTGGYEMPPEQIRATETAAPSACLCGLHHV